MLASLLPLSWFSWLAQFSLLAFLAVLLFGLAWLSWCRPYRTRRLRGEGALLRCLVAGWVVVKCELTSVS